MSRPELIPSDLAEYYEWHEWRNGLAVLAGAFPDQWADFIEVLREFRLYRSDVVKAGGNKSSAASRLDRSFKRRNWEPHTFAVSVSVDGVEQVSRTHEVDSLKGPVALEVEWNNKDTFYARDLDAFRQLFDLRAIEVGVIVTRCDELMDLFVELLGPGGLPGRAHSVYGATTTHIGKLLPRLEGGAGGGCPIVVAGIKPRLYVDDEDPALSLGPSRKSRPK